MKRSTVAPRSYIDVQCVSRGVSETQETFLEGVKGLRSLTVKVTQSAKRGNGFERGVAGL